MRTTRTVVALAVAAVLVVVTAGAATAGWLLSRDDATADRGTCDDVSWELSVEREDGGHEASFELQSTAPGETWSVVVEQGGSALLRTERTTDEDGELDVDVLVDPDATDAVTVAASYDGRTCSAATRW